MKISFGKISEGYRQNDIVILSEEYRMNKVEDLWNTTIKGEQFKAPTLLELRKEIKKSKMKFEFEDD